MTLDPKFGGISVVVSGPGAEPITLKLRQMDGLFRVAFSCEAAEMFDAIERGESEARTFGMGLMGYAPVRPAAHARAARFLIEMSLALSWAWISAEGADHGSPELWSGKLEHVVRLVRDGDADLGVPPLVGALGSWFNGPLLETVAEGEGFGPSPSGAGAAGPSTATAAVH